MARKSKGPRQRYRDAEHRQRALARRRQLEVERYWEDLDYRQKNSKPIALIVPPMGRRSMEGGASDSKRIPNTGKECELPALGTDASASSRNTESRWRTTTPC